MWRKNLQRLHGRSVGYAGSALARPPTRPAARQPAAEWAAFGYPPRWPAGPWVVPMFWVVVALGTWLLRALG
jgi:hypothetical protein